MVLHSAYIHHFDDFIRGKSKKIAVERLPDQNKCQDKVDNNTALDDPLGLNEVNDDSFTYEEDSSQLN